MIFYLTFGQKSPFRKGWVEIEAEDEIAAVEVARDTFGEHYSNIYEKINAEYFPSGKLGETLYG